MLGYCFQMAGLLAFLFQMVRRAELALAAVAMGADYVGSGAVYETTTKSSSWWLPVGTWMSVFFSKHFNLSS